MNDDTPKILASAAWLPFASLAISAAAFSMGASARIARGVHLSGTVPAHFLAEVERALSYEPLTRR